MRTTYDLSPLYRSMIGIDRVADLVLAAAQTAAEPTYPPYDIEKTGEDAYRVTLAAAGFSPTDLEITAQANLLVVTGRRSAQGEPRQYLHRGIPGGDFEKRFELADHVVVKSADFADGVLKIDLVRELPEALKPRRIAIAGGETVRQIEDRQGERQAA